MESAPSYGSFPSDYSNWLNHVKFQLSAELTIIPEQIEKLSRDYDELVDDYSMSAEASRGLSGNMEVKKIKSEPVHISRIRPQGTLMVVGGIVGFLVLGITWIIKITRKTS
jgi:hypothetical protein